MPNRTVFSPGSGARLWAFLAFVLLGTAASYLLARNRLDPEFRSSDLRAERRRQRIEAIQREIRRLDKRHPWAGDYYQGDHLGSNLSLEVAPEAGYHYAWAGCLGTYQEEGGKVVERDGKLFFHGAQSQVLRQGLTIVPWSERVYLIAEDELADFANAINLGVEPRYESGGSFFLRDEDLMKLVSSRPSLPPAYAKLLLERPIDAKLISVGGRPPDPGCDPEHESVVVLDAGRRAGVLPGMEFVATGAGEHGYAKVLRVNERSSLARFSRYSKNDPKPRRGWRVSTVYADRRNRPPWGEAKRVRLRRLYSRPLPPCPDEPEWLFHAESLDGAAEYGFNVTPVADIEASAVDGNLIDHKAEGFRRWVSTTSSALGANAFVWPINTKKEAGPRPFSIRIRALRVEFAGAPIEPLDFPHELSSKDLHGRLDWKEGRLRQLLNRNGYEIAEKKLRAGISCRLLKLSPAQYSRLMDLRVEDLLPEQREALRRYLSPDAVEGRIRDIEFKQEDYKRWGNAVDAELNPKLLELQKKIPRDYAEYRRLKNELDPSK